MQTHECKFNIGDIVMFEDAHLPAESNWDCCNGSIWVVVDWDVDHFRRYEDNMVFVQWILGPMPPGDVSDAIPLDYRHFKLLTPATEMSDAPSAETLPPVPDASPALGIRTSSAEESPSRPLGRRGGARSRK
jgi:hypothetical protein